MHAGFPQVAPGVFRTLHSGMQSDIYLKGIFAQTGGHLVAEGLALALHLGFGVILRNGLLDEAQSRRAAALPITSRSPTRWCRAANAIIRGGF